ncbi:MAG TPA: hypothetical protein VNM90_08120, partial [Haliangium sp.]|nr:hypothetical protein [Haliangium sp.]
MSQPSPFTRDTPGDDDGPGAGDADAAPSGKRKHRVRRAIVWSILSLALLIALVVGVTMGTLARLDNPTISDFLRGKLAEGYGLDVTYDALSIDVLGGLHAENLRVRTPAPYTEHAPYLLHIARVDATWDFWSFVNGEPRLGKIDVEGVTLAVVVDEHGGSSLLELAKRFPPSAEEEPEVVPLSHLIKDALPALAVDALSVRDVGMEVVQIQENQVQRRVALTGVCLGGPFQARPGALSTELRLGSCDQGLKVAVVEPGAPDDRPREMVVSLDHEVKTPAPDQVQIAIRGQLVRQDLVPDVALPEEVIVASASVRFDPAANRTHVTLDELRLLGGVFTAEARVMLDDQDRGATAATVERLAGRLDGSRLAALAPGLLAGVTLADTALTYEVTDLAVDAASGLPTRGNVAVRGDIGSVRVDRDGQKLAVDEAHLAFDLELPPQAPPTPEAPEAPGTQPAAPVVLTGTLLGQLQGSLRIERLDADMAGQRASVRQLDVSLAGSDLALDVASPQASRGKLTLTAGLAGAEAVLPDAQAELGALRMTSEITAEAGSIRARGDLPLASVSLTQRGGPRLRGRDLSLTWRVDDLDPQFARPAEIHADARVGKLDVADAGQTVAVSDARAKIGASVRSPTSFDARVELPVAAIDVRAPDGVTLALRDLDLGVRADDMVLGDEALPRGQVAVTSSLPRLSARTPTTRAEGRDIALTAEARLAGNGPLTLSGTLPLGKLEVHDTTPGAGGPSGMRLIDLGGARLAWRVEDLVMHPTDPLRTRGRVHLEGALPEVQVPGERMYVAVPRLALDATLHGARKAYDVKLRMNLRAQNQYGRR